MNCAYNFPFVYEQSYQVWIFGKGQRLLALEARLDVQETLNDEIMLTLSSIIHQLNAPPNAPKKLFVDA